MIRFLVNGNILYVAMHSEAAGILFLDLIVDNRRYRT